MKPTSLLLLDSFKSARGELQPLFAAAAASDKKDLIRRVRRYVTYQSRHMRRQASVGQQRSQVRGNLSLLLHEAKRQRCAAVAEAALLVAAEQRRLIERVDAAWVKDAIASCRSAAEVRALAANALQHPRLAGPDASRLIAAITGQPLSSDGAHNAVQLGSEDDVENSLAQLPDDTRSLTEDRAAAAEEAEMTAALALSGGRAPLPAGYELLDDRERSIGALARLHAQREQRSIAPNASFARYFLRQGIVRGDVELAELFQSMRSRPNELGFRVQLSHPLGPASAMQLAGRPGLRRVPWLPASAGAFLLDSSPHVDGDTLARNRRTLRALSAEGIGRYQSLSSMLPVHFLDPQPHEAVLDLCAAPGSKSSMLLDYVQSSPRPVSGCVAAGEADARRFSDLQHRLRSLSSPALLTLRADGTRLAGDGPLFDKVLVDAPCSGEGRMGRDAMAWRLWHPSKGLEFFERQRQLLVRALALCRVGGRVVYATCTLNPIENEAVVAAALREAAGAVSVLRLPTLRNSISQHEHTPPMSLTPGLASWYVPSRDGSFYSTVQEAARRGEAERLPSACFPPGPSYVHSDAASAVGVLSEEAIASQLSLCRRVLPHRNNGREGFFIAMLEKVAPLPMAEQHQQQLLNSTNNTFARSVLHSAPPDVLSALRTRPSRHSRGGGGDGATATDVSAINNSSPSLLHCREDLLPLPVTHPVVARNLASYFRSGDEMAASLQRHCLACVWEEQRGLRLCSQAALHVASGLRATSLTAGGASAALLGDIGALAVHAAQHPGYLTLAGARVLLPLASARVLRLPRVSYLQLLLARGTLVLDSETIRMVETPLADHALARGSAAHSESALEPTRNAMAAALRHFTHHGGDGAAILTVGDDHKGGEGGSDASPAGGGAADDTTVQFLKAIPGFAVPARVRVVSVGGDAASETWEAATSALAVEALIEGDERRRLLATIGRLRAMQRRQSLRHEQLKPETTAGGGHGEGATTTMSSFDLHGTLPAPSDLLRGPATPASPQRQQASPSQNSHTPPSSATPSRYQDGEDAFEV